MHTATLPPLGADTWVHAKIIGALDRGTHDVHVAFVPTRGGRPTPTADALANVDSITRIEVDLGLERVGRSGGPPLLGILRDALAAARSIARLAVHIRRNDISILHTSDRPRDALACILLGRVTRARSVVHLHQLYSPWMGRLLQWTIRQADARITVSRFVADSLERSGVSGPTYVVLNAIESERWVPGVGRDSARAELGIAPEAPVVITVCRLFEEKGVSELVQAIADVRRTVDGVRLVVVGHDTSGSGYLPQLEAMVVERELGDTVIFTGRRPDIPRLMAAADVFAMPSVGEPFGLVYTEAMAMRLPVVALDNGGTREIVVHGEHGLLSEYGDHDALVRHLSALLTDGDLRERFGAAARRRVEQHFDVRRMAADTAAAYRLISSRS